VLLLLGACSAQPPAPALVAGPALPGAGSGAYCLSRGGVRIGHERYTIRDGPEGWIAEGVQRFEGAMPIEVRYQVASDRDAEPTAFSTRIEIYGEHREVRGLRRGPWWELSGSGIGGAFERKVAWAPGMLLGFPSPIFEALMLGHLAPRIGAEKIEARGMLLAPPELSPAVRQMAFVARSSDARGRRYAISPGEGLPPIAVWLGDDRLPNKVRRFGDPAPLDAIRTATCAEAP
jgi:hypothetical protein